MLSRETNAVMQKAAHFASKMEDQYVSLEHLLLAILSEKSTASQMLKDAGVLGSTCKWLSTNCAKAKK